MSLIQIIVLAIVQGLTEFLPISSSGHLVLVPVVFGWHDQGLAFDVAVHFGTLAGVVGYFHRDILSIGHGMRATVLGRDGGLDARLGWMLLIATLPVAVIGLLGHDWIATNLRSPLIIAITTVVFAILLWGVDYFGRKRRDEHSLGAGGALFVGCAQALALIPGTSRSGITMTAGLGLGLTREAAARFSFLLSVPVIVMAATLETWRLVEAGGAVIWSELLLAAALAGSVAYLTIGFFLRFVGWLGMAPFAIYRILIGLVIFYAYS